jgi:alcohol dehydrogenase (NADP+)
MCSFTLAVAAVLPLVCDRRCAAYGGYADYVRVDNNYAFKLADNIPSDVAAPLMCAGATVFTPLKQEGVKAGDRVGVVGIGGLGHLAIQFIRALGATPIAFSRSANKEQEIRALGAEEFYNLSDEADQKKAANSVDFLVLTADAKNIPYNLYLSLVRKRGTFIMVGLPNDDVKFSPFFIVPRAVRVRGSLIGTSRTCWSWGPRRTSVPSSRSCRWPR